jgi:hypothetical protein
MKLNLNPRYLLSSTLIIVSIITLSFTSSDPKPKKTWLNLPPKTNNIFSIPCGFVEQAERARPANIKMHPSGPLPLFSGSGVYQQNLATLPVSIPTSFINANRTAIFTLQPDGNLVLYEYSNSTGIKWDKVLWATGTNGRGAKYLWFQLDGNLILTTGPASNIGIVWASNIASSCAGAEKTELNLQDDGNLVLTYPKTATTESVLGSTGTPGFIVTPHPNHIQ